MSNSTLCSCVICREVRSAKGIRSHYTYSHTKEGEKTKRLLAQIGITKSIARSIDKWRKYYQSPKLCELCNCELDWFHRKNRYCSSRCAAIYNGSLRPAGHESRLKGNESRSIKLNAAAKAKPKFTKVSQCVVCFKWSAGTRRACSDVCRSHIPPLPKITLHSEEIKIIEHTDGMNLHLLGECG